MLSSIFKIKNLKSRVRRKFIEGGKILNYVLLLFSFFSLLSADTTDTFQHKIDEEQEIQKRKCYFMFSTNFFWHKGLESNILTAGPCLNLGIETSNNNYFGINYYWGPISHEYKESQTLYDKTYGGGFVYKHNFPLAEMFKVSPGVQVGYWNVRWLNFDWINDKSTPGKEHFFGGPVLSFDIGYDRFCIKPEFFLSIGTGGVIPTYSVGVNWRVKESTRDRKTRFIFSTNSKSAINLNKDDSLGMSEESWAEYDTSGLSIEGYQKIRAAKGVYLLFIGIGAAGVTEGLVWFIIGMRTKDDSDWYNEGMGTLGFYYWGHLMIPSLTRAMCFLIPGLIIRRRVRRIKENSKKISLNPGFDPINRQIKLSLTYDF